MNNEEKARTMALDWQESHEELAGLVPHLAQFDGYWWASFRPPGATRPNLGGTVLLIDPAREVLTAASGSRPPAERIADYEASFRRGRAYSSDNGEE